MCLRETPGAGQDNRSTNANRRKHGRIASRDASLATCNSTAAPAATAGTSKRGRQAAGGFLIAEEAAGAAALSDHCPRKIQQAAYESHDNRRAEKLETLVRIFFSTLRSEPRKPPQKAARRSWLCAARRGDRKSVRGRRKCIGQLVEGSSHRGFVCRIVNGNEVDERKLGPL